MNKTILYTILAVVIVVGGFFAFNSYIYHEKQGEEVTLTLTLAQAIAKVQQKDSKLSDYPSDNLPPKRIESEETKDGWLLGFETRGSGLPGILSAECFVVSKRGIVESTGTFAANGKPGPERLNLSNCTAVVGENLDGEADPSRMTLDMKKWDWINALYNDGRTITPKPSSTSTKVFAIWFNKDGTFTATTDCNSIGGSYVAKDGRMTFGDIFMTQMYCEGSQEKQFLQLLEDTVAYHFTGRGQLIFDLKYDSGTVTFR